MSANNVGVLVYHRNRENACYKSSSTNWRLHPNSLANVQVVDWKHLLQGRALSRQRFTWKAF